MPAAFGWWVLAALSAAGVVLALVGVARAASEVPGVVRRAGLLQSRVGVTAVRLRSTIGALRTALALLPLEAARVVGALGEIGLGLRRLRIPQCASVSARVVRLLLGG